MKDNKLSSDGLVDVAVRNFKTEIIDRDSRHVGMSFEIFDFDKFLVSRAGFDKFFEATEKKMEEAGLPQLQRNRIGLTAWSAWKAGIEFAKKEGDQ